MALIRRRRARGFTLIELLVVIVLLGVLAAIGIPSFISSQKKSRDMRRKSELGMLAKALEMYNNDTGQYPAGGVTPGSSGDGTLYACPSGCTGSCCTQAAWGTALTLPGASSTTITYMQKLPKDGHGTKYYYEPVVEGGKPVGYRIYARLENTDDADVPKNGTTPQHYVDATMNPIECQASGAVQPCNYVVLSSSVTPPSTEDE